LRESGIQYAGDLPTFGFTFWSHLDFIGALGNHNRNGWWEFGSYITGSPFKLPFSRDHSIRVDFHSSVAL
jgi:hypothetical protein